MAWAPVNRLGGLCIAFAAACGEGATSPSDGSTTPGTGGTGGAGGVAGTGGDGGGPPSTGGSVGTGGSAGTAALSFAADIWPVFDQTRNPPFDYRGQGTYSGCTTAGPCHGSASPGAGLSMIDSSTAYGALVNVASRTSLCATAGGTIRVVPGDPDRSCLIQFYVGRLKDDLKWVDQSEIDLVRRWIAEGARP
jgi:hypothetical protein